jgi:hypothetical protein
MSSGLMTRRALRVISGDALPASPIVSDVFLKTGSSAGLYACFSAGVWTNTSGGGGGVNIKRNVQAFSKNNQALEDITGLSFDVEAGGNYSLRSVLYLTNNSGVTCQFAIAGTLTGTVIGSVMAFDNDGATTPRTKLISTLGAGVQLSTTAFDFVIIEGTVNVQNAGTLTVQFALTDEVEVGSGTVNGNSTFQVEAITPPA